MEGYVRRRMSLVAFWPPKTITCWGFFFLCVYVFYVGIITSLEGKDSNWPELASFIFFLWHVNHPSSYSAPKCCVPALAEGITPVMWRDTVSAGGCLPLQGQKNYSQASSLLRLSYEELRWSLLRRKVPSQKGIKDTGLRSEPLVLTFPLEEDRKVVPEARLGEIILIWQLDLHFFVWKVSLSQERNLSSKVNPWEAWDTQQE